jgi:Ulp1 family protease
LLHEAHDKGQGEAFSESCDSFSVVVPRQNNFSDCGCFLLEYAERFLKGPPYEIFNQILAKKDSPEGFSGWFAPSDATNRRKKIESLIDIMADDYEIRALARQKPVLEDRSSDIEEIIL